MESLDEIKKLLAANRKDILELRQEVEKMRKQLFWNRVASILRILIIIVPLILGVIYFMPFIDQLLDGYKAVFNELGGLQQAPAIPSSGVLPNGINTATEVSIDQLIKQLQQSQ